MGPLDLAHHCPSLAHHEGGPGQAVPVDTVRGSIRQRGKESFELRVMPAPTQTPGSAAGSLAPFEGAEVTRSASSKPWPRTSTSRRLWGRTRPSGSSSIFGSRGPGQAGHRRQRATSAPSSIGTSNPSSAICWLAISRRPWSISSTNTCGPTDASTTSHWSSVPCAGSAQYLNEYFCCHVDGVRTLLGRSNNPELCWCAPERH